MARAGQTNSAALIIAGGRGTRFWPESRTNRPKPLFSLDNKKSLLAATVERIEAVVGRDHVFVLVSADQARAFRRAVRDLIPAGNLIVEPAGRGTAVAIAYGAAKIGARLGTDTVLVITPADHYIEPAADFRRTIAQAIKLAAGQGAIVVVGIVPTRAESGYGYQKIGRKVGTAFAVKEFIEKPPLKVAQRMVRSGEFLWNAGIFVMRVATLTDELQEHAPALAEKMARLAKAQGADLARIYSGLDYDSFDRVVVERSSKVLGVRARFRWYDVGSWEGLWEAMRGRTGNVVSDGVIALESQGVLARGGERLMVLFGVNDLIAVDTGDAILIARRSRSQEVRRVTEELKRRGLSRYL